MIPNDPDAELAVVGALVRWPEALCSEILPALSATEFYAPANGRLFSAVGSLRARGEPVEPTTLADELRRMGEQQPVALLFDAQNHAERRVSGAVRIVQEMALRRRLLGEALELQKAAVDPVVDPASLLDGVRSTFASLESPLSARPSDDEGFDDFLARTSATPSPWVVEGLLRQQWRVVIVGLPGAGKTQLRRQVAACAAYGLPPLRPDAPRGRPVRVFDIELENPEDHTHHTLEMVVSQAKRTAGSTVTDPRIWRRPGGIDLRSRADRSEIEKMFVRSRPELLVMGPLKNSYRVTGKDNWDLIAREVQGVLNEWRERFNLTMFVEDHAPHGNVLRPYGSVLWEQWPEIGLGLESELNGRRKLSRFRGDRMPTDWPDALVRGTVWPWIGRWDKAPNPVFEEELF